MNKKLLNIIGILIIIFIYALIVLNTSFAIPCIFNKITGFQCPGCGITRMYIYMFKFDFKNAFMMNPIIFCAQPFIYYIIAKMGYAYISDKKYKTNKIEDVILYIVLILLILYGILRNIF